MGLFDFVKEAGERLTDLAGGILGRDEAAAADAGPSIEKAIHGLGIPVENLSVTVANDVATTKGTTESQADRERVVLVAGNAMKYPTIFEANRPMLSDPDKIYPGQVLRIPNEDSA